MSRGLKPGQKINRRCYKKEIAQLEDELSRTKAKINDMRKFVQGMADKFEQDFGYQVVLTDMSWRFPVEEEGR